MNTIVMPDGAIKKASDSFTNVLLKNGGIVLKLKPINYIYADQQRTSNGAGEVSQPKRDGKLRRRKREILYSVGESR